MKQLLEDLFANNNIRATLSSIRAEIKDEAKLAELKKLLDGRMEFVVDCLHSEDAKTRKNATLLLGDLAYEPAKDIIYGEYLKEETLFIKEAYLLALSQMDVSSILEELKAHLKELSEKEISIENQKHIENEKRALRKIIIQYEGISHHTFCGYDKATKVILTCNKNHREIVRRQIGDKAKVHPLGVMAEIELEKVFEVRSFREIIFPIGTKGLLPQDPKVIAKSLCEAGIVDLLQLLHKEDSPFYYRIECRSSMDLEKRSDFSKKLSAELDLASNGRLINSAGDYEVELRLIANKEGKFFAGIKLSTIRDKRFNYRKNAISASIHPSAAALIMELAKPYLVEHAQILDPFCGVGTMLIERNYAVNAREIYGIDIFGDAIEMARENTDITGMRINYIHKDFFDFKHDYRFDEIITNMPVRGKKTKEEMDKLYEDFFNKSLSLLSDKGIIVMYTNEVGFVKKNLRINNKLKLLQETLMLSKGEYYLMIIGQV